MYASKLLKTVAAVALLTASSLPAMAGPLVFDFTSVLNSAIGPGTLTNAQRTLVGTLSTNNAGQITGALPTWTLGGLPITNILNVGGSYTPSTLAGPAPFGPFQITSFNMQFTPNAALGIEPQVVTAFLKYAGGNPQIAAFDGDDLGGTSRADFTPRELPEIDGGVLPKGLFLVAGAFLMLFGRKRAEA
jgi:hypothetical protein